MYIVLSLFIFVLSDSHLFYCFFLNDVRLAGLPSSILPNTSSYQVFNYYMLGVQKNQNYNLLNVSLIRNLRERFVYIFLCI